ncbi:MAG: hypothetical protein K8R74_18455 [Bacteroidales bacterium]|nr:hypothetical protein [Bacteroidales bacterium]
MLKYTKTVLQKVSFNKDLFKRELQKSLRWLRKEEIAVLQTWCVLTFGSIYMDVINEVFK